MTSEPTFGDSLRALRKAHGMTQRELATQIGVTATYINLVESGKSKAPTVRVCRKLARALGVEESKLIQAALRERDPEVMSALSAPAPGPGTMPVPVYEWRRDSAPAFAEWGRRVSRSGLRSFMNHLARTVERLHWR